MEEPTRKAEFTPSLVNAPSNKWQNDSDVEIPTRPEWADCEEGWHFPYVHRNVDQNQVLPMILNPKEHQVEASSPMKDKIIIHRGKLPLPPDEPKYLVEWFQQYTFYSPRWVSNLKSREQMYAVAVRLYDAWTEDHDEHIDSSPAQLDLPLDLETKESGMQQNTTWDSNEPFSPLPTQWELHTDDGLAWQQFSRQYKALRTGDYWSNLGLLFTFLSDNQDKNSKDESSVYNVASIGPEHALIRLQKEATSFSQQAKQVLYQARQALSQVEATADKAWTLVMHLEDQLDDVEFNESKSTLLVQETIDQLQKLGPGTQSIVVALKGLVPKGLTKEASAPGSKDFDFSSVQVALPKELSDQMLAWSSQHIPEEILCVEEGGKETYPHVTVLYGIHSPLAKESQELLKLEKPFKLKLGKVSLFTPEDKDYEVVKVEVLAPELHTLNTKLRDNLESTVTFPKYVPHATLAYVKKGQGAKFDGNKEFEGQEATISELEFSSKDKEVAATKIPLNKAANLLTYIEITGANKYSHTIIHTDPGTLFVPMPVLDTIVALFRNRSIQYKSYRATFGFSKKDGGSIRGYTVTFEPTLDEVMESLLEDSGLDVVKGETVPIGEWKDDVPSAEKIELPSSAPETVQEVPTAHPADIQKKRDQLLDKMLQSPEGSPERKKWEEKLRAFGGLHKTAECYTDREMDTITQKNKEDSGDWYKDDVGGGFTVHDWNSNTNDFPQPKDMQKGHPLDQLVPVERRFQRWIAPNTAWPPDYLGLPQDGGDTGDYDYDKQASVKMATKNLVELIRVDTIEVSEDFNQIKGTAHLLGKVVHWTAQTVPTPNSKIRLFQLNTREIRDLINKTNLVAPVQRDQIDFVESKIREQLYAQDTSRVLLNMPSSDQLDQMFDSIPTSWWTKEQAPSAKLKFDVAKDLLLRNNFSGTYFNTFKDGTTSKYRWGTNPHGNYISVSKRTA